MPTKPPSDADTSTWEATRPANLALIKYMGKQEADHNIPANPSLSYTLHRFTSTVRLSLHKGPRDVFEPTTSLSAKAQQRFIAHLNRIKQRFGYPGCFRIASANNFPANCGLASSASSFAALTDCAVKAMNPTKNPLIPQALSELSRPGSGSSCRSFFSPWALWDKTGAQPMDLPYPDLDHYAIIASKATKRVSSSEAHQRVTHSALYPGRPDRAQQRLDQLIAALRATNWRQAFTLIWQEFWDMHALFETADPPFGYMTPDTMKILDLIRKHWDNHQDGPLVTLDAGPNVHVLFRQDQKKDSHRLIKQLSNNYEIH